jgi:hypothetical protein
MKHIGPPKLTVGFKCNPNLKHTLQIEANQLGLTLSEYVEGICEVREPVDERIAIKELEMIKRMNVIEFINYKKHNA